MGISAAMEIGRKGLNVFRAASEVTSENIANVNTDGYSRQRVMLETDQTINSYGFSMGTGVRMASIERYYNTLLQKQLVNAHTEQGFDTTKSTVLQQVEPAYNEMMIDGLGAAISEYFGAWQDLTLNPAGTSERQAVLTRGQTLVDNFHSISKTLTDTIAMQDASLVPVTSEINATLSSIADLNGQIKITQQVGGNANELQDKRDQLVRDLSSKIGLTFTENSDGTTDVNYADGGAALVTGNTAGAFSLVVNAGKYDVYVAPPAGAAAIVAPVTGELGATIALRDTVLAGYLTSLNTLANNLATEVNTQHTTGFDLNGVAGVNFFTGVTAATISVNIATTSEVAASSDATLAGDSSNALAIAQLANDTTTMGTSTFNGYYTSLVSSVGLETKTVKNSAEQAEAFTNQLSALRESNSGVSLDEELANLVKYQRSYQASAKLITTATEMLDMVIGMVR